MSTITYAGEPCVPPLEVRDHCARRGLPTDWFGLPNSWENRLGCQTGRGWLLMTRASLDKVGLDGERDLVMAADSATVDGQAVTSTVTHKSLHISGECRCLTPGTRGDPAAVYLVPLGDRRRILRARIIDRAYNCCAEAKAYPVGGPYARDESYYMVATLDPGSPWAVNTSGGTMWTWQTMIADIWERFATHSTPAYTGMGTCPTLPFTPAGVPEDFYFYGWYAMDALAVVLARLSCALALDTTATTFSFVRLAANRLAGADPSDAAMAAREGLRLYDDETLLPSYGRYPNSVEYFSRALTIPPLTAGGTPCYRPAGGGHPLGGGPGRTNNNPELAADFFGESIVRTHDAGFDEAAGGTLASSGLLQAASRKPETQEPEDDAERRFGGQGEPLADADTGGMANVLGYYRTQPTRLRRVYGAPLPDAGLMPGQSVRRTSWGDRGRGLVTEVVRTDEMRDETDSPLGCYDGAPPREAIDYWRAGGRSASPVRVPWSAWADMQEQYQRLAAWPWVFARHVRFADAVLLDVLDDSWSGVKNNWSPPTGLGRNRKPVYRVTGGDELTGAVPFVPDAGNDATFKTGQEVTFLNAQALAAVTVRNNSGSSSAGNRIFCPGYADYELRPGHACTLWYDTADLVWRFKSTTDEVELVDLATGVTGLLPVANGGTGLASAPGAGEVLVGNGAGYTLTASLGVGSGGTGLTATPSAGQFLVGNGAGFTLTVNIDLGED